MGWKIAVILALGVLGATPAFADTTYRLRHAAWTEADERDYGEFIARLGAADCRSVDACLDSSANPFRAADPPGLAIRSDCADLPYVLRFYYAWHRGLPFSYVSDVSPRGRARDIRYSARGNQVERRTMVPDGANAMRVMNNLRDAVSSATYRIHPELEGSDFYSPALTLRSIRPGTVIYDPNGHLAVVWRIERDGRIRYMDAHPDNSLTRGTYDLRFVRASPGMGAGFKNWRPLRLEGGRAVPAANAAIADYSLVQFFGTGQRPEDGDWKSGRFVLGGQDLNYYDYVRAQLAGRLSFDPLAEVAEMVRSNCADLSYRLDAVDAALAAGMQNKPQPARLPTNIYGTDGDWEDYSTPSRDARLKTAFQELRDAAEHFMALYRARDARLAYAGRNLAADMLAVYDRTAASCVLRYTSSDGSQVLFGYEDARQRLFRMSFDPYHCVERRWGARGDELSTCRDGSVKRAWYEAEQSLRNQAERTYDIAMDWSLDELRRNDGIGQPHPPDTDTRAYLLSQTTPRTPARQALR